MNATVTFVGAGPGAADLISLRGMKALQKADLVLYAGSLVNPELLSFCQASCQCLDSASMALEEQVELMSSAAAAGKTVVRLHTGDPSLYGAVNEQIAALAKKGIDVSIVPGISSVFAAAAALKTELTAPDGSQSVVLTRTPGRTPMRAEESAAGFARTGATLVFFLSAGKIASLMQQLMEEGNVLPSTPAAVVYRASWPDERIIRADAATLAEKAQQAGITRQALILVGSALGASEASSKLYAAAFSHGYRNQLAEESFDGNCALYCFTKNGLAQARTIAKALGKAVIFSPFDSSSEQEKTFKRPLSKHVAAVWPEYAAHIFIGATGIAVRCTAPLLQNKAVDPAVIALPENGSHVIPLVSGHLGGANRLARRIARITGGQAVLSTATDVNNLPAFDDVCAGEQGRVLNPSAIKALNTALLEGKDIAFLGPKRIFDAYFADASSIHYETSLAGTSSAYAVLWDSGEEVPDSVTALRLTSRTHTLGIGCRKGIASEELLNAAEHFLADHGLTPDNIATLATCDVKKEEEAITRLAEAWQKPLHYYSAEELAQVPVPTPSDKVLEKLKTPSVSEAASLLCAGYGTRQGAHIQVPKHIIGNVTLALSKIPHGTGKEEHHAACCGNEPHHGSVIVAGIGSGSARHITPEVELALKSCDIVAGYTTYLDFIRGSLAGKEVIQSGMRGEMARCTAALDAAVQGKKVCMVCSGDPGLLAMAGLLYELKAENPQYKAIPIRVLPGITAASIAAASLGAPLQNGCALVSLSDLLVPTDEVRENVRCIAKSKLPAAIYNPAGRKRRALLAEALAIFKEERGGSVYCAYVKNAGREDEAKWTGRLADIPADDIDMSTLLIVGGPRTCLADGILYEARGYMDKYRQG